MQELREEYLQRTDGDYTAAAVAFAEDLMRGDPATFKAGYTLDNAAIAAKEVFPDMATVEIASALARKQLGTFPGVLDAYEEAKKEGGAA